MPVENKSIARRGTAIYLGLLLLFVCIVCVPVLSNPPVSDDWEALYAFHHLDEKPGNIKWLHVLNHDPFEQMRYQPLSHLFLYVLHILFGSRYEILNIVNVVFYAANLLLLYRFARLFCTSRWPPAIAVGVFAFLFTHFDIALWSSHRYVLAGFGMMLLGFLSYARHLRTGRLRFIVAAAPCLLAGMWCYEAFALWPLALVPMAAINRLRTAKSSLKHVAATLAAFLGIVYAAYVLFYFFTRSLGTYDSPSYEIAEFLKRERIFTSGILVLFNALYNNVVVNLFPLIPFPLDVTENIYMGGPVIGAIAHGHTVLVYVGAAACALALAVLLIALYRRRHFETLKTIAVFLFLMLSAQYTIFLGRMTTNDFTYGLTEFRYQYASNACMVLLICLLVDRFVRFPLLAGRCAMAGLTLVCVLNIVCIERTVAVYRQHLAGLKHMLTGVRTGIREKRISPDARLHIDNEIHAYLPGLCWNYEMGARFMQGTYQWAFPPEEQCCFVADPRIAAWVIDPRSFDVVPNGSESDSAAAKRIHAGKEIQYNTVGLLLAEEGKLDAAVAEYRKALVSKPDYAAAHYNLANVLAPRGEIRAAIDHYRRAIELKSRYLAAFVNLGGLFDRLGQTGEALACYQRALAIDAEHYTAHYNCANALRKLGDRDRAITHYHQALRIEPESHDARNNLGSLLFEQGRHDDALIEFEAANRIEPTARTHFNLGVLCIRLGRTDEGRGHFRRALSYAEEDGDRRLTARIQKALPD